MFRRKSKTVTHLLALDKRRLKTLERLYGLTRARKSGRLKIHSKLESVLNGYSEGQKLLLANPAGEWHDELSKFGSLTALSEDPFAFHLGLMEFAEVSDKRDMLINAIRENLYVRCHFAYGLIVVADEARRMGLDRIAVIEFGVWKGRGLKNLASLALLVHDCTGVSFDVYGFDTGAGMPPAVDWRDHPELWEAGQMAMPDYIALRDELPGNCTLIIGPIEETIEDFCITRMNANAPLGFISFDMDYYSSTVQSLRVMENQADHYLPAMTIWVDDSYISIMQTHFAGEALALREFNDTHELRKFDYKRIRPNQPPMLWHNGVWFCHIFDHPMRNGSAPTGNFNKFLMTEF